MDVWVISSMRLSERNCISINSIARDPRPGGARLIVVAPEVALAAIAAAFAFLAQVVVASVLGAINADFGGGFVTDAAHENESVGHESGSGLLRGRRLGGRRSGFGGRLAHQHSPAPLGFAVYNLEFLFLSLRQIGDVLPQLVAVG